jgi:hypothetical protein
MGGGVLPPPILLTHLKEAVEVLAVTEPDLGDL